MKLFLVQKHAWVLIFYGFIQINLFWGKKEQGLIKFEEEERRVSFIT